MVLLFEARVPYMGQAVLEAAILPQPSKYWDFRGVPPGLVA